MAETNIEVVKQLFIDLHDSVNKKGKRFFERIFDEENLKQLFNATSSLNDEQLSNLYQQTPANPKITWVLDNVIKDINTAPTHSVIFKKDSQLELMRVMAASVDSRYEDVKPRIHAGIKLHDYAQAIYELKIDAQEKAITEAKIKDSPKDIKKAELKLEDLKNESEIITNQIKQKLQHVEQRKSITEESLSAVADKPIDYKSLTQFIDSLYQQLEKNPQHEKTVNHLTQNLKVLARMRDKSIRNEGKVLLDEFAKSIDADGDLVRTLFAEQGYFLEQLDQQFNEFGDRQMQRALDQRDEQSPELEAYDILQQESVSDLSATDFAVKRLDEMQSPKLQQDFSNIDPAEYKHFLSKLKDLRGSFKYEGQYPGFDQVANDHPVKEKILKSFSAEKIQLFQAVREEAGRKLLEDMYQPGELDQLLAEAPKDEQALKEQRMQKREQGEKAVAFKDWQKDGALEQPGEQAEYHARSEQEMKSVKSGMKEKAKKTRADLKAREAVSHKQQAAKHSLHDLNIQAGETADDVNMKLGGFRDKIFATAVNIKGLVSKPTKQAVDDIVAYYNKQQFYDGLGKFTQSFEQFEKGEITYSQLMEQIKDDQTPYQALSERLNDQSYYDTLQFTLPLYDVNLPGADKIQDVVKPASDYAKSLDQANTDCNDYLFNKKFSTSLAIYENQLTNLQENMQINQDTLKIITEVMEDMARQVNQLIDHHQNPHYTKIVAARAEKAQVDLPRLKQFQENINQLTSDQAIVEQAFYRLRSACDDYSKINNDQDISDLQKIRDMAKASNNISQHLAAVERYPNHVTLLQLAGIKINTISEIIEDAKQTTDNGYTVTVNTATTQSLNTIDKHGKDISAQIEKHFGMEGEGNQFLKSSFFEDTEKLSQQLDQADSVAKDVQFRGQTQTRHLCKIVRYPYFIDEKIKNSQGETIKGINQHIDSPNIYVSVSPMNGYTHLKSQATNQINQKAISDNQHIHARHQVLKTILQKQGASDEILQAINHHEHTQTQQISKQARQQCDQYHEHGQQYLRDIINHAHAANDKPVVNIVLGSPHKGIINNELGENGEVYTSFAPQGLTIGDHQFDDAHILHRKLEASKTGANVDIDIYRVGTGGRSEGGMFLTERDLHTLKAVFSQAEKGDSNLIIHCQQGLDRAGRFTTAYRLFTRRDEFTNQPPEKIADIINQEIEALRFSRSHQAVTKPHDYQLSMALAKTLASIDNVEKLVGSVEIYMQSDPNLEQLMQQIKDPAIKNHEKQTQLNQFIEKRPKLSSHEELYHKLIDLKEALDQQTQFTDQLLEKYSSTPAIRPAEQTAKQDSKTVADNNQVIDLDQILLDVSRDDIRDIYDSHQQFIEQRKQDINALIESGLNHVSTEELDIVSLFQDEDYPLTEEESNKLIQLSGISQQQLQSINQKINSLNQQQFTVDPDDVKKLLDMLEQQKPETLNQWLKGEYGKEVKQGLIETVHQAKQLPDLSDNQQKVVDALSDKFHLSAPKQQTVEQNIEVEFPLFTLEKQHLPSQFAGFIEQIIEKEFVKDSALEDHDDDLASELEFDVEGEEVITQEPPSEKQAQQTLNIKDFALVKQLSDFAKQIEAYDINNPAEPKAFATQQLKQTWQQFKDIMQQVNDDQANIDNAYQTLYQLSQSPVTKDAVDFTNGQYQIAKAAQDFLTDVNNNQQIKPETKTILTQRIHEFTEKTKQAISPKVAEKIIESNIKALQQTTKTDQPAKNIATRFSHAVKKFVKKLGSEQGRQEMRHQIKSHDFKLWQSQESKELRETYQKHFKQLQQIKQDEKPQQETDQSSQHNIKPNAPS